MLFEKIQGQTAAVEVLRNILKSGRAAHAYLFSGPAGVGKKTCARLFAEALKGDINQIEPDGSALKIEQIRKLQKDIFLTSHQRKVYLICEAEKMTEEAANCLLKVLEEPPTQSILILLTQNPYRLLATIRSRCQTIYFQRLSAEIMHNLLQEHAGRLPDRKAELIIRLADGSLSQALNYLNQPGFEQKRQQIWQTVELCLQRRTDKIFLLASSLEEAERDRVKANLTLLAGCYRDILIWQKSKDRSLLLHQDKEDVISRLGGLLTHKETEESFNAVIAAVKDIEKNSNIKLLLENLFLRLCKRGEVRKCIQWLG